MINTYTLTAGSITSNGESISLENDPEDFSNSGGAISEPDGYTTGDDSLNLGSDPNNSTAPYTVTFGDGSGTDEFYDLTLNYGKVTLTEGAVADQLYVYDSLSVLAGTIDLGNSGELSFDAGATTFLLNGTLRGSGQVDASSSSNGTGPGGTDSPAITGSGTILSEVVGPNTGLSIDSAITGNVTIEIASGSTLSFGQSVGATSTVHFLDPSSGQLQLNDAGDLAATVYGLGVGAGSSDPGSDIDLGSIALGAVVSTSISNNIITITGTAGTLGTIALGGANYNSDFADWKGDNNGGTDFFLADAVCFLAGTRILTPAGNVAVETLKPGDMVTAEVDGQRVERAVKWVGYRRLELKGQRHGQSLSPIRIKRGAFADNLPERDLLVSPPHCLFMDGKLIPAKLLINGMTVTRETAMASVEYYHIELDRHAILVAEGVASESYLDTGNRAFFSNGGLALILHPEFHVNAGLRCWEVDACAPLAVSPAAVRPSWQAIADRALSMGYSVSGVQTTTDADIHILANGRRIDPVAVEGNAYRFLVPGNARTVALASRSVVPSDLVPYLDDPRQIGVAVRKVTVRGQSGQTEFAADHPALATGWHAAEQADGSIWRWTKGCGVLPVATSDGPVIIDIAMSETTTYKLHDDMNDIRIAA